MPSQINKTTTALIYYIISRLNGVLGKTHLQKLLFLTDLISANKYNQKVTDIEYKKYFHGPYSDEVKNHTDLLAQKGLIEAKEFSFNDGSHRAYTRFYAVKPANVQDYLIGKLGSDKMVVLEDVISSFGNMSLKNLLDVVYGLQIVSKSELNDPLKMVEKAGQDTSSETEEPEDNDFLS